MAFMRLITRAGKHNPGFSYSSPISRAWVPDVSFFSFFSDLSGGLINYIPLLTKLASFLWRSAEAGNAPAGRAHLRANGRVDTAVWYIRLLQGIACKLELTSNPHAFWGLPLRGLGIYLRLVPTIFFSLTKEHEPGPELSSAFSPPSSTSTTLKQQKNECRETDIVSGDIRISKVLLLASF